MSCGTLGGHGHGHGPHGHGHPGDDPDLADEYLAGGGAPWERAPAPDEEADGDGGWDDVDEDEEPRRPSRIKAALAGAWAQYGYYTRPLPWGLGVDGVSLVTHQALAGSPLTAVITVAVAGATAEAVTEVRNHQQKRRPRWKTMTRQEITAASAWALLATAWTPAGWMDIVQWIALGGGLVLGGRHVFEERKARRERRPALEAPPRPEAPPEPEEPELPPPPDRRLTIFTEWFCTPGGPLAGVTAGGFREVAHGFMLELEFPLDSRLSMADVEAQRIQIAKLYNCTRDAITIDYVPGSESELRCQVIIRQAPVVTVTGERQPRNPNQWDGRPTWNPATGLIDIGTYIDDTVARFRMNTPRSGSALAMVVGVPGAGKTTTLNVIGCEAGQAMLCARCGARGDCGQCSPERVMAVWAADPQEQGLSLWRGRADLTGWGAEGTVELLEFVNDVDAARGKLLSSREYWDTDPVTGAARHNVGQGWFDPEVGLPQIVLLLDELPVLVRHPDRELALHGLGIIADGIMRWRKRGIMPVFGSQLLDASQTGVRELRDVIKYLNMVAHRVDEVTNNMGGITGDPRTLPADLPGAGFIAGPDRRPGVQFATKGLPEARQAGERGIDARHLVGRIAQTPIRYDAAVLGVMEDWGVPHQAVFEEWNGRPSAMPQAPAATAPAAAQGPAVGGMAYREDADAVLKSLQAAGGPQDKTDIMTATGLNLGPVARSLEALELNGQVVRVGDRQFQAA